MTKFLLSIVTILILWGCSTPISTYREQYIDTKCSIPTEQLFNQLSEYFLTNGYTITNFDINRGFMEAQGRGFYSGLHGLNQSLRGKPTNPNFLYEEKGVIIPKWSILQTNNKTSIVAICQNSQGIFYSDSTLNIPTYSFYWKTRNEIKKICGNIEFKDKP
ncbi:MAG: hypothetical protein JNL36_05040 [Candidatus Kapabacteria bacterium]|nr:hypothetical protein [Candidatus Kapabacteria bacterium]